MKNLFKSMHFNWSYIYRAALCKKGLFISQIVVVCIVTMIGLFKLGQWSGISEKVKFMDAFSSKGLYEYCVNVHFNDDYKLIMNQYHLDTSISSYVSNGMFSFYDTAEKAKLNENDDLFSSIGVCYGSKLLERAGIRLTEGRMFGKNNHEIILGTKWKYKVKIGQKIYVNGKKKPYEVIGFASDEYLLSSDSYEECLYNDANGSQVLYDHLSKKVNGNFVLLHPQSDLLKDIVDSGDGNSISFVSIPKEWRTETLALFGEKGITLHDLKQDKEAYYSYKYESMISDYSWIVALILFLGYLLWLNAYIVRRCREDILYYCSSGIGVKRAYCVTKYRFLFGTVCGWFIGSLLYQILPKRLWGEDIWLYGCWWHIPMMGAFIILFVLAMLYSAKRYLLRHNILPKRLVDETTTAIAYYDLPIPEYLTAEMAVGSHFIFQRGMKDAERRQRIWAAMEMGDITMVYSRKI